MRDTRGRFCKIEGGERRSELIAFRVAPTQRARVEALAEAAGEKVSTLVGNVVTTFVDVVEEYVDEAGR